MDTESWQNESMASVSPCTVNSSVWTMFVRTTLQSVDPSRNRFRFFIVELWAPPVGEGAAIRKRWGRIGTPGRSEVLYFDGIEGAEHYAEVLLKRRHKRGYVEVETPKWSMLRSEADMEARLRRLRKQLVGAREGLRKGVVGEHEQLALDLAV